jgi:hypothetical protein
MMAPMKESAFVSGFTVLHDFDGAWREPLAGVRHRAVRRAAEQVRERFVAGPRVVAVRTIDRTTLPYPTKYAFASAALSPAPFVTLTHRTHLVQFLQKGVLKNMLFNPTDIEAARETPYFARLLSRMGRAEPLLAKGFTPLTTALEHLGLAVDDIDYVAFDHFHTQDLRGLLGTKDGSQKALFPNAVLLAPKKEWDDWDDLHPVQRAFFVHDGKKNVATDKVLFTAGDLLLGDGVMLLRTPGHTSGNQTLFLNTEGGVWGISENGTAADNWSPVDSKIPRLASVCRQQDLDVVINSNTPESAADQYTSMVLERTIVSRVSRAPAFVQMFPSSEVTPSLLSPGLAPTIIHRAITSGAVSKPARQSATRPERPVHAARTDTDSAG